MRKYAICMLVLVFALTVIPAFAQGPQTPTPQEVMAICQALSAQDSTQYAMVTSPAGVQYSCANGLPISSGTAPQMPQQSAAPNATTPWNGEDGTLEFVHGDVMGASYGRTPLTAKDHARICDISFIGSGFGGFERVSIIVPAGGDVWELNVSNAETIACWGFLGTPAEVAAWAITTGHLQNFVQASRDTHGNQPSFGEIMVLQFTYEGGVVTVKKEAPDAETGDIAGWFVSHFDLNFHEGSVNSNQPFTVTR